MKFRPHRELLDESMREQVEIEPTMAALRERLEYLREYMPDGFTVEVRPYGYDARIDWNTHIVVVPGWGVAGWTDEQPSEVVK